MISSVRAFPAFASPVFASTAPATSGPAAAGKTPAPSAETTRWKLSTRLRTGGVVSYEAKKTLEPGKPPVYRISISTPGGALELRSDQPPKGYPAAKWADALRRVVEGGTPVGARTTKLFGPIASDVSAVKSGELDLDELADELFNALLKR